MAKALDQLVVIDLTFEFWGALAGAMLGDFGADVIHVESLARGERLRLSEVEDEKVRAHWLELTQRNKKSVALDLATEDGLRILNDLIVGADVFLTDLPAAELRKMGLDYEALANKHPALIYAHGSGFGGEGDDANLPALDELAAARTGMMPILPQPGQPPVYPAHGQMYTTIMLGLGIMIALHHRDKTGEGQEVHSSLLAGNMYGASLDVQAFLAMRGNRFLEPVDRMDAGNPMSGTMYMSEDGLWVTLTMPDTDRWWPMLAELVGLDPADPRYDSHDKRCGDNRLELIRDFEALFAKKPAAHWRQVFLEKQLSADVIEDYEFPASDQQVYDNRYIIDLDHPSGGPMKTLGFPIFMSDTPATLGTTAPCVGQHTDEVLHERLSFSQDEITELKRRAVVASTAVANTGTES